MSPTYIKAIHALRRRIPGLAEDDVYRDLLENLTGKRSSKDLTDAQGRRVLAELDRLAGGRPASAPAPRLDPKSPLVGRILREAYSAGWDVPEEPGPFDASESARRALVRTRVQTWLQQHYPHIHGTPRKLEAWPMEALQACLEHLKGKVGASKRWEKQQG